MRYERTRVEAARALMWLSNSYRECRDCGTENPYDAPCCGVCGGPLEERDDGADSGGELA